MPPPAHPPIRVALVEDDVYFQNAVTKSIAAAEDMTLTRVASTRAEGLRLLDEASADVLLVDLGLPDGSGIDLIVAAQARWPACGVMVCTAFGDEANVLKSIEAGAAGYLLKDSEPENILQEIRSLHAGGSPISPLIARQILTRFRSVSQAPPVPPAPRERAAQGTLSAREQEVLELITKGFSTEEISGLLQVSSHTVLTYVRRIYGKLKVNSRAEAIYEARQQGLLSA